MARTIWYRINGGAVQTVTGTDTFTGPWAAVDNIPANTPFEVSTVSSNGPWISKRTKPAEVVPADRIPAETLSLGGRPNNTPVAYYKAARSEFLDPVAHPHIMGITHRTVKSGRFSDRTVWDTGTVPGTGSVWSVSPGHTLIGDNNNNTIFKDALVEVGGTFRLATDTPTRWRLDTFMTMGNLVLVDHAENPIAGQPKHEFIFHRSVAPGASARLGLMAMSSLRIHGAKKTGHLRANNMSAGSSTITLRSSPATNGWRVGDTLHILGTEYVLPATSDPHYKGPSTYYGQSGKDGVIQKRFNSFQFGQDEERIITAISGNTITLNRALTYSHTGMSGNVPNTGTITVYPVVTNVSRSIRFRSASAEEDSAIDPSADVTDLQKRAHTMFMRCEDIDVRYFETKNMARTDTNPTLWVDNMPYRVERAGSMTTINSLLDKAGGVSIHDPLNVRGRYAVHFHWSGGPYKSAPLVPCVGITAWAPIGGVPIPGWAITQHASRVSMEDCVVSNFRGAGFVSELGNETGQWVNCVATGGRGDGEISSWGSRSEVYTNHNGHAGVAFDNQSRAIVMHGCIAGSSHFGWLWTHQKSVRTSRTYRDVDLRFVDGMISGSADSNEWYQDEDVGSRKAQIPPMHNCEAHACREGFNIFHRAGGDVGPDMTPLLVERFHCLNVPNAMAISEYSNRYYFTRSLWQGPLNSMDDSSAFQAGVVTWDWNLSNILMRNYRRAFSDSGMGLNYDGFFIDIAFENVTIQTAARTVTINDSDAIARGVKDIMPDYEVISPTSARIRVHKSISSSTLPQPYPLNANWSRKLPAGSPPVPIGGKPYFVLGDGVNGANSSGINLTLRAGAGRGSGHVYGVIRDCVGDRAWPSFASSESFPNQLYSGTNGNLKPRRFLKMTPEQVVRRWACYRDGTTWKTRVWFFGGDRYSHVRFTFHIDYTLEGFDEKFLTQHEAAIPPAPEWPDKLEAIPANQPPLRPKNKDLKFLSANRIEVVSGRMLGHDLLANDNNVFFSIVGGANASLFRITRRQLQWANNGSRNLSTNNNYEVVVRVRDGWGNFTDVTHQVIVLTSSRVSDEIIETFSLPAGNLSDIPGYNLLQGPASGLFIHQTSAGNTATGRLGAAAGQDPQTIVSIGSVGSSDMFVRYNHPNWCNAMVLFRLKDANNWLGARRNDASNRFELFMCVDGVISTLAHFANVAGSQIGFEVSGNTFIMKRDPENQSASTDAKVHYPSNNFRLDFNEHDTNYEHGALVLPDNAPKGTEIGFRTGTSGTNSWVDNVVARPLKPILGTATPI